MVKESHFDGGDIRKVIVIAECVDNDVVIVSTKCISNSELLLSNILECWAF